MSDRNNLIVEILNGRLPQGQTRPIRHFIAKDGLVEKNWDDVSTLYENFQHSVEEYRELDFLGVRSFQAGESGPYVFQSYKQVAERVRNLAAYLSAPGLKEQAIIGLYSINKPEWLIVENACYALNLVPVPLYDTLGEDAIKFIFTQTQMETVFLTKDKILPLLNLVDGIKTLKHLVSMDDDLSEEIIEMAEEKGLELLTMAELEKKGQNLELTPRLPKPEDLATICYTSGTTGTPKGVMHTHRSMISMISAALRLLNHPPTSNLTPSFEFQTGKEIYLSYLPLAHILERAVVHVIISGGGKIGFYQGQVLQLMNDLGTLKPTIFVSVPRLFNRIFDKVMKGVETKGVLAQVLFRYAYYSKLAYLNHGFLRHLVWDQVVFKKVRSALGGRVKVIISGSAPLSAEVTNFLQVAFSCKVLEGYGMTETCGITCVSLPHDFATGTVGIPVPCAEIKLVDVSDMGYTAQDKPWPRGEIWVRGPSSFVGYFKEPEKTKETLTSDGWVITGDIGEIDGQGRLRIIDRKKSLLKLAQGEYVSPEKVENVLIQNPLVAQAFVEGDSLKPYVVAVIVPDPETLETWAENQGISLEEAYTSAALKEQLMKEIANLGSHGGTNELKGFEIPKDIYIEKDAFSVENNLLTPTFKLKREIARKQYRPVLQDLYIKQDDILNKGS